MGPDRVERGEAPADAEGRVVLGVDPALGCTGIAALLVEGGQYRVLHTEDLCTNEKLPTEVRLWGLHEAFDNLIHEIRPHVVAVERIIFVQSQKTAILLGQARGAMVCVAGKHRIPVVEFSPMAVKRLVAGKGNVKKDAVREAVSGFLSLPKGSSLDVSDAAAVALTYFLSGEGDDGDG